MCIIDTGVRKTHQDLAANIKGGWNRWAVGWEAATVRAAAPGSTTKPTSDYCIADARCWFGHLDPTCRGEDASGKLPKPGSAAYYDLSDQQGHGTHTTGSVGAVGNNSEW